MRASDAANRPRWSGQAGFFEIWFLVVFEAAARRAWWSKHIWGTRRVEELYWLYCPRFDEEVAACLEATAVRPRRRPGAPRLVPIWFRTAHSVLDRCGLVALTGNRVEVRSLDDVHDPGGYDAVVLGSAIHGGAWLPAAAEFMRRNAAALARRPVWLFSSGPLGTAATDAQGRDLLVASEPKEFAAFKETITPRGLRVFFGALDPSKLGFSERLVRSLPAGRALLPEGDFRDWEEIEAWAESIAHELVPVTASRG